MPAILACCLPALQASVVYTNGTLDSSNGNEMTQWIQANSFSFGSTTTVTNVTFDVLQSDSIGIYAGDITYILYADNAGAPGTQLASGDVITPETSLGPAALAGYSLYTLN